MTHHYWNIIENSKYNAQQIKEKLENADKEKLIEILMALYDNSDENKTQIEIIVAGFNDEHPVPGKTVLIFWPIAAMGPKNRAGPWIFTS